MGKLIAIEGTDGSGKHTQTELLYQALKKEGKYPVRQLSFPCYDSDSSALVKMYLGGKFGSRPNDVNPYAASTFYAVDRYASFKTDWEEFYNRPDSVIITDRYTISNAIHQASKLPPNGVAAYLTWLWDFEYNKLGIPKPDMVLFLDVPTEVSSKLRKERETATGAQADIHEKDDVYLARCRRFGLELARALKWEVVSCVVDGILLPTDIIHQVVTKRANKLIE